jgi:hypothetical protein
MPAIFPQLIVGPAQAAKQQTSTIYCKHSAACTWCHAHCQSFSTLNGCTIVVKANLAHMAAVVGGEHKKHADMSNAAH